MDRELLENGAGGLGGEPSGNDKKGKTYDAVGGDENGGRVDLIALPVCPSLRILFTVGLLCADPRVRESIRAELAAGAARMGDARGEAPWENVVVVGEVGGGAQRVMGDWWDPGWVSRSGGSGMRMRRAPGRGMTGSSKGCRSRLLSG